MTIFQDGQLTHSMLYSVLVTVLFTAIGMVITICAAYPLSRRRLKGRNFFSLMILFTLYFYAGLIPEYLLLKRPRADQQDVGADFAAFVLAV